MTEKKSKTEELILSKEFSYLQPYMYNNDYALRCELGIGANAEEFIRSAKSRAREIYGILFPNGADAVMFNYYVEDLTEDGDPIEYFRPEDIIAEAEMNTRLLVEYQAKFRHSIVRDLPTYWDDLPPEDSYPVKRHRIVCYSDGMEFDTDGIIDIQFNSEKYANKPEMSFVSFANECILSIYDERGCDAVFATYDKMAEFYPLLEPYFLDYDRELMEKRLNNKE